MVSVGNGRFFPGVSFFRCANIGALVIISHLPTRAGRAKLLITP